MIALGYPQQLCAVDTDNQCLELYLTVKILPATSTRFQIESHHGLNLNGDAFEGFPNLISANDANGLPCIVKILRIRDGADCLESC